jgi:hypothetical protein
LLTDVLDLLVWGSGMDRTGRWRHDYEGEAGSAGQIEVEEERLEESLGAPKPLVSDGDDLSIGKLVGLLEGAGSAGHILIDVEGDITKLIFNVPDDLALGGGGEGVSALGEDLHEVVGEASSVVVDWLDDSAKTVHHGGSHLQLLFVGFEQLGEDSSSAVTLLGHENS